MGPVYFNEGISIQNRRAVNMDSLLLKKRIVQGTRLYLAVICDGVGSLEDGAYAAASTVRMLDNWFENLEETDQLGPRLRDYASNINLAVLTAAQKRQMKTACTLSCILLNDNQYHVIHVGDSRVYLYEHKKLRQLTPDQVREGRIYSAVGHKKEMETFYMEGTCHEEQKFLICSDGLYKRMQPEHLIEAMQKVTRWNMKKILNQLVEYVIDQGEQDNISAALLISGKGKVLI